MVCTKQRAGGGAWYLPVGLVAVILAALSLQAAEIPKDLGHQKGQQKQVQETTDHMVHRVGTMLRVMDYYHLDGSEEKKLLDEVAATLSGLSREQMNEVLARLESATKAPDDAKLKNDLGTAYTRHREIVTALKMLVARYDALTSLEKAAEKLETSSKVQLELYLQTTGLAQFHQDLAKLPPGKGPKKGKAGGHQLALITELPALADEQRDLKTDISKLFDQLAGLREQLPEEQKTRLQEMEAVAQKINVLSKLEGAAEQLPRSAETLRGNPQGWAGAAELQRVAAGDLLELALILRGSHDRLTALQEARERLDRAIQEQEALHKDAQATKEKQDKDVNQRKPDSETAQQTHDQAAQQARLELATRETQDLLKPHAPDLADKIEPAEKEMHEAEKELEKNTPEEALPQQKQATDTLRDVRKELDNLIAQAEKEQQDPLTALEKAEKTVDRLLQDQKDTREKTQEAETNKKTERLPHLAEKQQDLAKRTEDLKEQPQPSKPETQAALDKAAKAMNEAAKSLDDKQGNDALGKQDEAIKSLEDAKKELGDQVAEEKKRQEDIAKLEDAAKHLAELAKKEGEVASQADNLDKKTDDNTASPKEAKDLSQKQGELTPQAKEVGKEIEQAAPEAAKKVAQGTDHMDAAKGNLDKNQLPPAAKNAADAAQDLKDAQKEVAKALEEKKGEEIAEQAALEGKQVDPANAAQEIAKALEQAEKAAEQSEKAAEHLGEKSQTPKGDHPDLAKLQQQVADQASKMKLPQANKPAENAAKALEKGDLDKAVKDQKEALDQLQEAAKAEGQPEGSEAKSEEGKKAEPKEGEKGEPGDKSPPQGKEPAPKEGDPKESSGEKSPAADPSQADPANAKNAGELAQAQKALLEATQALAKSQEANQAAEAALEQAQAEAPADVQPQLQEAGKELANANQQLQQETPAPANQSQNQAVAQLTKALDSMNAALAAMGQPQAQPGQKQALASAKPGEQPTPGQKPGEKPGHAQTLARSLKPSPSQERNEGKSDSNRMVDGKLNNTPSKTNDLKGDGSFLGLPPRERDMIMQALSDKLPPEYSSLIQQYYVNVARGKPAAKPVAPDGR